MQDIQFETTVINLQENLSYDMSSGERNNARHLMQTSDSTKGEEIQTTFADKIVKKRRMETTGDVVG